MTGIVRPYAEIVADAVRRGPCLTGHDWWEATYTTTRCRFECDDLARPRFFIQERRCNRCGHHVTHVRRHRELAARWDPHLAGTNPLTVVGR